MNRNQLIALLETILAAASASPNDAAVDLPSAPAAPVAPPTPATTPAPVVIAATPDTVTLPVTHHTLSLPHPEKGEMFVGYCQRVASQAGGNPALVGMLFSGTQTIFAPLGGYKDDGSNWPEAADRFYNARAYMTPEQLAADDASRAQFGAMMK